MKYEEGSIFSYLHRTAPVCSPQKYKQFFFSHFFYSTFKMAAKYWLQIITHRSNNWLQTPLIFYGADIYRN